MKGVLRVIRKELEELLASPRALFITVLAPPIVILMVGWLQVQPPTLKLLVSGLGGCDESGSIDESSSEDPDTAHRMYLLLAELSWVDISCEADVTTAPLSRLQQAPADLLLNIDEVEEGRWVVYAAESNPKRMIWQQRLAQGIAVGHFMMEEVEEMGAVFSLGALEAVPVKSAHVFYPDAIDRSLAQLPGTFGFVLCFLSFLLTAPGLVRERENRTLEILLTAPKITGRGVVIGKSVWAVLVCLVAAALMLVTIQVFYKIYVKPDTLLFALFLVMPLLSSALLGITVSGLAQSQNQGLMAAAAYFVFLLVLTGFIYPTEGSSDLIQILSQFLPLTHLLDVTYAWMFGADVKQHMSMPSLLLIAQCFVYALTAWLAWRQARRRI